jgi:hypothetical protein
MNALEQQLYRLLAAGFASTVLSLKLRVVELLVLASGAPWPDRQRSAAILVGVVAG